MPLAGCLALLDLAFVRADDLDREALGQDHAMLKQQLGASLRHILDDEGDLEPGIQLQGPAGVDLESRMCAVFSRSAIIRPAGCGRFLRTRICLLVSQRCHSVFSDQARKAGWIEQVDAGVFSINNIDEAL